MVFVVTIYIYVCCLFFCFFFFGFLFWNQKRDTTGLRKYFTSSRGDRQSPLGEVLDSTGLFTSAQRRLLFDGLADFQRLLARRRGTDLQDLGGAKFALQTIADRGRTPD